MKNNGVRDNTAAAYVAEELAKGKKPNRLIDQKSPYLLQHAFNPVQWYPWGEEAFVLARHENRPIFLSIGYSTCHWCHVMAHESFENQEVAAIMNRFFVCIKVDREERPDLDQIYMAVTQAMTGSGGWPMSVFLTPELKPFYAGTYFPVRSAYGRPGFVDLLNSIHKAWLSDQENIVKQAEAVVARLVTALSEPQGEGGAVRKVSNKAARQLAADFDRVNGGFGGAPKFPRPVTFNFLQRFAQNNNDDNARHIVLQSLRKMAAGGIYDQLGGGFHRYSVDAGWRVPHFEKMLYDQAQLVVTYLEAAQVSGEQLFRDIAAATLDYVLAEMRDAGGGFYSAEDADSPLPEAPEKHGEGAFYLWSHEEVSAALSKEEAELFIYSYGIQLAGNAPADPHGDFRDRNILYLAQTPAEAAVKFKLTEERVAGQLAKARQKLLALRVKRPRPHLDDKVLSSWNGLMISALAKGYLILGQDKYLKAARDAAGFIHENMYDEALGTLWHRYREGEVGIVGQLDDYAFVVQGLLDLYEASFEAEWLEFALQLTRRQIDLFADNERGGFFESGGDDPSVLVRMKSDYDGAEPAGNSIAAINLLRLGRMIDSQDLLKKGEGTIMSFGYQLQRVPTAMPQMLTSLEFMGQKPTQVVIAGSGAAVDTRKLQRQLARFFMPNKVVMLAGGEFSGELAGKMSKLSDMIMLNGKATAYVCENFTCRQPVTDPEQLKRILAEITN